MLLAIDIGNTTIALAVLEGTRVHAVFRIEVIASRDRFQSDLKKVLESIRRKCPAVQWTVLCSVVPDALRLVERAVKKHLKTRTCVVGRDIPVPMKNNYRAPWQVGMDRLVCAYAAKCLYGYPAIVIDFGTAITFDVISAKGGYEGGIIVPGIRMSADSLFQKTALLPNVSCVRGPRVLVGKNTQESILSGIFYGYGAMSCGLIDRLSARMKRKPKVIVTGGHTHLMRKFIAGQVTAIDRDLVLKGIGLVIEHSGK